MVRCQTKSILGLQHIRITARLVNLLLPAHPLGVVDTVNVILDLKHNTPVLGDRARELVLVGARYALRLLEGHGAVLPVARVHLEGVLVGEDVELDARPWRRQGGDWAFLAPVVGADGTAVVDVAGIYKHRQPLHHDRVQSCPLRFVYM